MAFVAGHQAAEVLQRREEALDLPAAAVAPELPAVLGHVSPGGAVRREERYPALGHPGIHGVTVVAAVADNSLRQRPEKARLQRVLDEGDVPGIRTCDSNGERKTSTVCDCHDLGAFAFAGESDGAAPFFAPAKVASMKASVKS